MNNAFIQFTQDILQAGHISAHRITLPCENWDWLDLGLRLEILQLDDLTTSANNWIKGFLPQTVYHSTDEFQCNYTIMLLPNNEEYLICGPVLFEQIKTERFEELFRNLDLPEELRNELQDYYLRVPFVSSQSMYENFFTILAKHLYGPNQFKVVYTDTNELDDWYQVHKNYLRIPEEPFMGIRMIEERYELENELLTAVANCNETRAVELGSRWAYITLPHRLPNTLRDHKDYVIAMNTLMRKTAEQSGVHPIHIDSFSNSNVQNIEQITSLEQFHSSCSKIARGYCRLIREHNLKTYSLLTRKAITYIDTDLRADLSLKSLSEQLSVNPNYLSTLFKKEIGIPLTDYVNHCRIKQAQRLLLGTDMPIKSVALQCGIPNITYFSRLFKRITGMTPKVYRETATYEDRQELSKSPPHRPSNPL
ncbi:MAG: helix-turn-helix domain-containing protein [Eubacteriales bacterium]|nr:helix-turn-helix domain-containing protein [Eubacteriales bacterium]